MLYQHKRIEVIQAAHDDTGHHGFYTTQALVIERYWWPFLGHNIAWYVQTCHICQTHQTQQILILLVITTPAPLFAKMCMDMMHLLHSCRYLYIVQGQCSLTGYPEF